MNPHSPTLPGPPRQARSRETMEALLQAGERLLERETFEMMTVQEVASRAGVTTGAFYARFGDKAGFLRALEERLYASFGGGLEEELDPERWASTRLLSLVRELIRRMLKGYRARRGLVRAIALAARTDPALDRRLARFNREKFIRPLENILLGRDDIAHSEPANAIRFALFLLANALSAHAVFPESNPIGLSVSDEVFVENLASALLRYLQVDE